MITDLFIISSETSSRSRSRGITAYCRRQDLPWRIHSINRQKMRPLELYAEQYPDRPLWLAGYIGDGLINHLARWGDRLRIFTANKLATQPPGLLTSMPNWWRTSCGSLCAVWLCQPGCWGNWQIGDVRARFIPRPRRFTNWDTPYTDCAS